jgi:adhesin/invasin
MGVEREMSKRFSLGVLIVAAAVGTGCEKVPLLAPTASTISVSAQTTVLPPGGSTPITATVVESGGTPVQNGTLVRFSASLGRVEPAEVETRGGSATTTFIAGSASGAARITATSGAASGGEGDTAANVVTISIGGAAAATVTVSASPSRVGPSGGTVTVVASALDASGNRLVGVPINFSTDVGTLSASSAITDSNGEARVTLTTDRQAVVTARAGDKSATVTVTVATAGTVSLTTAPANPVPFGTPVTLTVTPAANTSPRVVVTWGDGSSDDLGIVAAPRAATHTYQAAGSYTITATATADGQSFTTATSVTMAPRPAINVNVTASTTTPAQCAPVTFTATVTGDATASISSYRWTIASNTASENESLTTSSNQLTRAFQTPGRKTVSVTATTIDGRTGDGQTQVVVQTPPTTIPPTPPPVCP